MTPVYPHPYGRGILAHTSKQSTETTDRVKELPKNLGVKPHALLRG